MTRIFGKWIMALTRFDPCIPAVRYSKYPPYAFTEQGVAMLSAILHGDQAVGVQAQCRSPRGRMLKKRS